jgi:hypothetical protein
MVDAYWGMKVSCKRKSKTRRAIMEWERSAHRKAKAYCGHIAFANKHWRRLGLDKTGEREREPSGRG